MCLNCCTHQLYHVSQVFYRYHLFKHQGCYWCVETVEVVVAVMIVVATVCLVCIVTHKTKIPYITFKLQTNTPKTMMVSNIFFWISVSHQEPGHCILLPSDLAFVHLRPPLLEGTHRNEHGVVLNTSPPLFLVKAPISNVHVLSSGHFFASKHSFLCAKYFFCCQFS